MGRTAGRSSGTLWVSRALSEQNCSRGSHRRGGWNMNRFANEDLMVVRPAAENRIEAVQGQRRTLFVELTARAIFDEPLVLP